MSARSISITIKKYFFLLLGACLIIASWIGAGNEVATWISSSLLVVGVVMITISELRYRYLIDTPEIDSEKQTADTTCVFMLPGNEMVEVPMSRMEAICAFAHDHGLEMSDIVASIDAMNKGMTEQVIDTYLAREAKRLDNTTTIGVLDENSYPTS